MEMGAKGWVAHHIFYLAHDLGLPQEVHVYHSLYPLQHSQMAMPGEASSFFGHPTSVYKAVSGADGRTYVLYRIEGRFGKGGRDGMK